MKQLKNERGLTLVELLAVIVILAIIAAIAAVAIGNVINNSKDKAILSDAVTIIDGAKIAVMDDVEVPEGGLKKAQLEPYVELSDEKWGDQDGVKVEVLGEAAGKTTYVITYPKLAEIKNDKYKPDAKNDPEGLDGGQGTGGNKATLEALLSALEGKKE